MTENQFVFDPDRQVCGRGFSAMLCHHVLSFAIRFTERYILVMFSAIPESVRKNKKAIAVDGFGLQWPEEEWLAHGAVQEHLDGVFHQLLDLDDVQWRRVALVQTHIGLRRHQRQKLARAQIGISIAELPFLHRQR